MSNKKNIHQQSWIGFQLFGKAYKSINTHCIIHQEFPNSCPSERRQIGSATQGIPKIKGKTSDISASGTYNPEINPWQFNVGDLKD